MPGTAGSICWPVEGMRLADSYAMCVQHCAATGIPVKGLNQVSAVRAAPTSLRPARLRGGGPSISARRTISCAIFCSSVALVRHTWKIICERTQRVSTRLPACHS